MSFLKILILLLAMVSCSSRSVKIHNQSDRFIDIEVSKGDFYSYCAYIDKKENKSIMSFYAIENDIVHEFFFRRISQTDWCLELQKKYNRLTDDVPRVKLVGIDPSLKKDNTLKNDPVPEKFKGRQYVKNWVFIRLETIKGCKSYFDTDCEPENYWGGLFPQN